MVNFCECHLVLLYIRLNPHCIRKHIDLEGISIRTFEQPPLRNYDLIQMSKGSSLLIPSVDYYRTLLLVTSINQ